MARTACLELCTHRLFTGGGGSVKVPLPWGYCFDRYIENDKR
jgi:hypothetical protein